MLLRLLLARVVISLVLGRASAQGNSTIHGEVVDQTGQAIASARVAVSVSNLASEKEATTDSFGRFEIAGLSPGHKEVRFAAPGFRHESIDVILSPNRSLKVDMGLTVVNVADPGPQKRLLSVRVVDENGQPVPRAVIYLRMPWNPRYNAQVTADSKGRFRFVLEDIGEYEIHALGRNARSGTVLIEVGFGPLAIDVDVVLRTYDLVPAVK